MALFPAKPGPVAAFTSRLALGNRSTNACYSGYEGAPDPARCRTRGRTLPVGPLLRGERRNSGSRSASRSRHEQRFQGRPQPYLCRYAPAGNQWPQLKGDRLAAVISRVWVWFHGRGPVQPVRAFPYVHSTPLYTHLHARLPLYINIKKMVGLVGL